MHIDRSIANLGCESSDIQPHCLFSHAMADTVQSIYNSLFAVHRNGLRSIGMDRVISESCYKETILQRNYRKMTISWSFSFNSFVKFHGKRIWDPQHDRVISQAG